MREPAFTPGPWAIRRGHSVVEIRTVAGLPLAQTTSDNYWENFKAETLANARLIAAAPALYEALRHIVEGALSLPRFAEEEARAALSFALGESPNA